MQISTILAQIDLGAMALPEFQRGYVWSRDQVRELMTSLYKRYPVGGLLIWKTRTEGAHARGDGQLQPGYVDLILDGQQRVTSLYGVIRGKAPAFFQGNKDAFTNLYFNIETETFKFYSPKEMDGNPFWVSVTELMQPAGVGPFIAKLQEPSVDPAKFGAYITRLNNVASIQTLDFHVDLVTGEEKTIDIVVEIFNKVNSGGTKLSKGDLALAKICASWPDARKELQNRLSRWSDAGFYFDLDWLLRNITTVTTGQALFTGLANMPVPTFQQGLKQVEQHVNHLLNLLSARLGLDHHRVLGSRYAFPVMTRLLATHGGALSNIRDQNRLLYFYIHAFLWGRYAGSTESVMNADIRVMEEADDPLAGLITILQRSRGDLRVRAGDFAGNSLGARFYPMLYLLTRTLKAHDWGNGGLELNAHMLGKTSSLQVHHIFPKAQLRKRGYKQGEINALANFCFLTQIANLEISDRDPAEYFATVEAAYPGVLASQWVPMDRELWHIDRFRDFLATRRELLAQAANSFLDSLITGAASSEPVSEPALERVHALVLTIPGGADGEELEQIRTCNDWVEAQGLPRGEELYELSHPESGAPLAVIDLAWPRGIQEGLSQPIALLLNESEEVEEAVNQAGYTFFTDPVHLCAYIERTVLAVAETGD
ncbi:DUF262 domain-containing protein [Chloroflexales bacterium ZM16-3]|nr:DUF262 domain-containing protein [Chloroflexales bacterium ZM16-3]